MIVSGLLVLRRIGSYLFPLHLKNARRTVASITFAIAGGLMKGEHRGDFSFDDTDPYKIIRRSFLLIGGEI